MTKQAQENPRAFMSLLKYIVPKENQGANQKLKFSIQIDDFNDDLDDP